MANTEKIYCYIDESGQDTGGDFFVVALVVTGKERDDLSKKLLLIEQETGKKTTKWSKSKKEISIQYLTKIFESPEFKNKIYYSLKKDTKAYKELTILAIAATINKIKTNENYKASIFIDGLLQSEIKIVSTSLRQIGIRTEKVRGVRDESNPIIRLADSIAGLISRNQKKSDYTQSLIDIGTKKGIITLLK